MTALRTTATRLALVATMLATLALLMTGTAHAQDSCYPPSSGQCAGGGGHPNTGIESSDVALLAVGLVAAGAAAVTAAKRRQDVTA